MGNPHSLCNNSTPCILSILAPHFLCFFMGDLVGFPCGSTTTSTYSFTRRSVFSRIPKHRYPILFERVFCAANPRRQGLSCKALSDIQAKPQMKRSLDVECRSHISLSAHTRGWLNSIGLQNSSICYSVLPSEAILQLSRTYSSSSRPWNRLSLVLIQFQSWPPRS
jgi:hypothetical protein